MRDPLLDIGAVLLVIGVVFLFLTPIMTFWCFLIGGGLIFAHSKTLKGRAQSLQARAENKTFSDQLFSRMSGSFAIIGIAVMFLGVFPGLFLNFGITLWCFVIGGGFLFAYSKTPQAKAQLAQSEVENKPL